MTTQLISTAMDSRVPLVSVRTDDLLWVAEILTCIAGVEVVELKPEQLTDPNKSLDGGAIYYTHMDAENTPMLKAAYRKARNSKSTIINVNPKCPHVLCMDAGQMVAPRAVVRQAIKVALKCTESEADNACNAMGGLSLREAYDLCCVRNKFHPADVTPGRFARIRQELNTGALKGLTFISTSEEEFYEAPTKFAQWIDQNAKFFINPKYPHLVPRGLLFDGPPGTGKTAGAKYLASRLGVPLLRLDLGGLKGSLVGESEQALTAALAAVDQVEPCVLMIDEVEKYINRGSSESRDAGVTAGLLGQLLWWMQEHKTRVLVVMTTNKAEILPPELCRPGRIDETHTFLGLQTEAAITTFLQRSFMAEAARTWKEPNAEALAAFTAYMESQQGTWAGEDAVPQARLVERVSKFIRTYIINSGELA